MKAKVSADDIAQLLTSAPPRIVASHVRNAAMGGGAGSWFMLVFGLIFGGMGLVFLVIFFPWNFWDDWRLASDSAQSVPGLVTGFRDTNLAINETQVVAYDFSYTPPGGATLRGECYTTGERWKVSAQVVVRYLPEEPTVACIEGARLSQGGWIGVMGLIFPLVGGGIVWWWVRDRLQKNRVLREGLVTEVNVYRIVVAGPELASGQPVTVKRVNKADVELALKRARDGQPVFVLYDPKRSKHLLFPEAWVASGT
jgi:Protein of unknown function (DUF3592)